MADQTGISWTDVTFNPWLGCEKVSPGCAHCYAETLARDRMGIDVWGPDAPRKVTADSTWRKPIGWNRESLAQGRRRYGGDAGERIRVFCASMADVFEPRLDLEQPRRRLFDLIEATPALDWLILTKRPDVARAWLFDYYMRHDVREWVSRDDLGWGVLPNIWIGTSIENSRWTWRADVLREIPAAVRFISAEPLLGDLYLGPISGESPDAADALRQPDAGSIPVGSIDDRVIPEGIPGRGPAPAGDALEGGEDPRGRAPLDLSRIDWLIVGGESGSHDARPMHPVWARLLRDDALSRGIPLHFKQWGSWAPAGMVTGLDDGHGLRRDIPGPPFVWRNAYYRGSAPKSSGKLLDGIDYCEFPKTGVLA